MMAAQRLVYVIAIICTFYISLSSAVCSEYCTSCGQTFADACDGCVFGYGLFGVVKNYSCTPCAVGCIVGCKLKGAPLCDACTTTGCSSCNSSYSYDVNRFICVRCDLNCVGGCSQSGAGKCDQTCISGWSVNASKICIKCDVNCASGCSLSGPDKCDTACKTGFSLWNSTKTCVVCDSKCLSTNGCTTSGPGKCDSTCQTLYEVNSTKNCILTINGGWSEWSPNCTDGYNGTRTRLCNNPTPTPAGLRCLLTNGTRGSIETLRNCPCDVNCNSSCLVNGANKCDTTCIAGYSVSVATKNCVKCDVNCDSGCAVEGAGKCDTKCKTEYTLLSNKTCAIVCDIHCASTCARNATCDGVCEPDWLNLNKICVQCDPNCWDRIGCSVRGANKCDRNCTSQYSLFNGTYTCVKCDDQCADKNSGCIVNGAGKCDSTCNTGYELNSTFNCIVTINGNWSDWSPACTDGYTGNRTRTCTNPTPTPKGLKCPRTDGVRDSIEVLRNCPCDVNCNLTFGCLIRGANKCDTKCVDGTTLGLNTTSYTCQPCDPQCTSGCQTRGAGRCDSTCKPGYGLDSGNFTCQKSVNGSFSDWRNTSTCTALGQPTFRQQRDCNNPAPAYGGALCTHTNGTAVLVEIRDIRCPCDTNCASSGCTTRGYLSCDSNCVSGWGLEVGNYTCMKSVDGNFGDWSNTSTCTTLGQTTYRQRRDCNNPPPSYGGALCQNSTGGAAMIEFRDLRCPCDPRCQPNKCGTRGYLQCDDDSCNPAYGLDPGNFTCLPTGDGGWSDWVQIDECTTYGQASKTFLRNCSNPYPTYGGKLCLLTNSANRAAFEYRYDPCVWCDKHCISNCTVRGNYKCDTTCENGYGVIPNNYTCGVCPSPCNGSCNAKGPGSCDGPCIFGYGLTQNLLCSRCAAQCSSGCNVKGAGKCDSSCNFGYALSTTDYTCQPCDAKCTSGCTVPYKCSSACIAGFVVDSATGTCLPCDTNCIKTVGSCNVRGKNKCDSTCVGLFALSSNYTCQPCGAQCTYKCSTDGPGYCDVCPTAGCASCVANFALKVVNVNKHSCFPCAAYCSSGCIKEGPGCCDSSCQKIGTYTYKWTAQTSACHTCK